MFLIMNFSGYVWWRFHWMNLQISEANLRLLQLWAGWGRNSYQVACHEFQRFFVVAAPLDEWPIASAVGGVGSSILQPINQTLGQPFGSPSLSAFVHIHL
jgi:hypothetical protein